MTGSRTEAASESRSAELRRSGARLTWVIKASKLCNLRCKYCYEFDSLADPRRIPADRLRTLFTKIRDISATFQARPKICWHGGEPLLLPPEFYYQALAIQEEVFGGGDYLPPNVVQTNLTRLSSSTLALLRRFSHISISLDLFGGLRRDARDADSQQLVLENMSALANAGIGFGAITVLTSANLPYITKIFEFFNSAGIGFRVLPFYRSASKEQIEEYALSHEQIVSAFTALVDLWLMFSNGISIQPIDEYIRAAALATAQTTRPFTYNKRQLEHVYVVDTNGDLYSVADTYDRRYCHGNLFDDSVTALIASPNRSRAIAETERRMAGTCDSCDFFGYCSGWAMGEATPIERRLHNDDYVCAIAKPTIEYAADRVRALWPTDKISSIASSIATCPEEYLE